MKNVFEPTTLGPIKMANRIIRSATTECLADEDGRPTEELIQRLVALAEGGVGAIITGQAGIRKNGRLPVHRCLMIDRDEFVEPYRRLASEVHKRDTAIILQIGHAGRQTRTAVTGEETVAPSAIRDQYWNEQKPRELEDEEIEELITDFIRAIERAKAAGFDGVQLHAAHGWLLSQFLSPYMNRRKDKWGGGTRGRFRVLERIIKGAQRSVGDFPILVKINALENRRRGVTLAEALKVSAMLEAVGCAGIEVSCGVGDDGFMSTRVRKYPMEAAIVFSYRLKRVPVFITRMFAPLAPVVKPLPRPLENYNVDASREIKKHVSIPVIVVGGIRRLEDIGRIISENDADYVAMSRPFIAEPDIVNRFKQGEQGTSRCISCGYCLLSLEENAVQCFRGRLIAPAHHPRG